MKEPLAENRYYLTKPLFTEGMGRVWAESSGKSIRKLLALLGLVWLALTAVTLIQGGSLAFPLVELLILALVVLWACIWLPRGRALRAYRRLEERGAADTERVTCFFEDHLEVSVSGKLTSLLYSEISQILHSRNLLILVAEDKTGILIKRDSYFSGSEDEVLRLIQQAKEEEQSND